MKKLTILVGDDEIGRLMDLLWRHNFSGDIHIAQVGVPDALTLERPPMERLAKRRQKREVIVERKMSPRRAREEVLEFAQRTPAFKSKDLMDAAPVGLKKMYSNALFSLKRIGELVVISGNQKTGYVYGRPSDKMPLPGEYEDRDAPQ